MNEYNTLYLCMCVCTFLIRCSSAEMTALNKVKKKKNHESRQVVKTQSKNVTKVMWCDFTVCAGICVTVFVHQIAFCAVVNGWRRKQYIYITTPSLCGRKRWENRTMGLERKDAHRQRRRREHRDRKWGDGNQLRNRQWRQRWAFGVLNAAVIWLHLRF